MSLPSMQWVGAWLCNGRVRLVVEPAGRAGWRRLGRGAHAGHTHTRTNAEGEEEKKRSPTRVRDLSVAASCATQTGGVGDPLIALVGVGWGVVDV